MNPIEKLVLKFYSLFIKKSHEYIIFESANDFYDNAYALFTYFKEHHKEYKYKYIITSKEMKKSASKFRVDKSELLSCYNKLKLYKYSLKAKCIFFSYTNYWKKLKLQNDTLIMFCDHGLFPVKDCSVYFDYLFEPQQNKLAMGYRTKHVQDILQNRYPILKTIDAYLVGMPRDDIMYTAHPNKEEFLKNIGVEDPKNKQIIVSITTFRAEHDEATDFFKDEYPLSLNESDLEELNENLKKNNQVLIFKVHHAQKNVKVPASLSNLKILNNNDLFKQNMDLHIFFTICDALLTDYSGGYFDYLNMDRPLGFILADKEKYMKNRGFTVDDLESIMPGNKIYSKEALLEFFLDIKNNVDKYKKERAKIRKNFLGDYGPNGCKSYSEKFLK